MAHVLDIMSSTDDTVTFTSGNMYLRDYVPQVSQAGEDIRETLVVGFTGSISTIRANIQSITRLFDQADNYNFTRTGARVYIEFDPDTSGTVYRSMVRSGRVKLTDRVLGWQWGASNLELEIEWTRVGYWEGPLTQIPLSNTSDTDNTSGITVSNADDSTHENWVSIASSYVIGDLPASIKVEIQNDSSGSAANKEFYMFHNVYSNPASFTHMLEAEDSTGTTVTTSTDANCQNASKATLAWSATIEQKIASWDISDAQATYAAGGRFAALARWKGAFPYTDMWIRLKLLTPNSKVIWSGNLSLISSTRELALLDVLRLPPYLENQASIKGIQLAMYGYRNASGTHSIVLDYLQLSPISGDGGWKRFLSIDDGIAYTEKLVHDDTESFDYRIDTGSKWISEYTVFGGPILLIPNTTQRLYFNQCDKDGLASIAQAWKVKLWYRPRRSSL